MAVQWLATDLGGPEVLRQVTVDLAPPGPREVTIEVHAAGMNPPITSTSRSGRSRP
jgi:NADPH:quinone reductase